MEKHQFYIPNHEKWFHYFQKEAKAGNSIKPDENLNPSITDKTPNLYVVPIDDKKKTENRNGDKSMKHVTLISPNQGTVEQAKSEVKRQVEGDIKSRKKRKKTSVKKTRNVKSSKKDKKKLVNRKRKIGIKSIKNGFV
ncbi:hypothetical protein ACF0H5_022962 [Mactra antiquata]